MKKTGNDVIPLRWRMPLALSAGLVILLIAVVETGSLAWLRKMPERNVDFAATARISERGAKFVRFLANRREVRGTGDAPPDWDRLHYLVDTLDAAQAGLEYVNIERNGRIVFSHRPGKQWHEGVTNSLPVGLDWIIDKSTVALTREKQTIDGRDVTILHFSRDVPARDGATMRVEVALRRDASDEIRMPADEGVSTMFHLAVFTSAVAFAICMVVVIWAIRRDARRERIRRREEHLAFSGIMANGIVHDFRNPMSAVRLDAQMLEREVRRPDGPRGERVAELSSRIGRTMGRLDGIFSEFLFLARPDAGDPERVDLREIVADRLEMLVMRFETAEVNCSVFFNGAEQGGVDGGRFTPPKNGAPLFVSVMKTAFSRSLSNILINAIQFSPKGGMVELAVDERGGEIWIEVRDRGPGIRLRDRERIFDMFITSRPGGTGLGLFFARETITHVGGTISAHPREGGGTVMRVILPNAGA